MTNFRILYWDDILEDPNALHECWNVEMDKFQGMTRDELLAMGCNYLFDVDEEDRELGFSLTLDEPDGTRWLIHESWLEFILDDTSENLLLTDPAVEKIRNHLKTIL